VQSPNVCVLLLNWRGWQDTIECLESVFRQEYARFQVVVCDNDSGNGSLERIAAWARGEIEAGASPRHPMAWCSVPGVPKPIRYVELDRAAAEAGAASDVPLVLVQTGGNLGFAGGNNVGLRYARARGNFDYVWLLNNDTVIDPGALRAMVDAAERDERVGMVGSTLRYYDEPDRVQALAGGRVIRWNGSTRHHDERLVGRAETREPDYITGASLLVRTELLDSVGEMDERYFLYSEEVDWCLRSRERGWRLVHAEGSVVWHKGGQSVVYSSPLHDYHTARGMLLLVRRFYPGLLPLAVAYSLYRCLAPKIVRLQYTRFRAVMRAYTDLLLDRPTREIPGVARTGARG
jgi:GT2 family glycosyltransferase